MIKNKLVTVLLLVLLTLMTVSIFVACDKDPVEPSDNKDNENKTPAYVFLNEEKTLVQMGRFPQTKVDVDINKIKSDGTLDLHTNWYTFEDKTYAFVKANIEEDEPDFNPTFSDGEEVVNGKEYAFLVEPIQWKVIYSPSEEYLVFSTKVLDSSIYATTQGRGIDSHGCFIEEGVYVNCYYYSELRTNVDNIYQIAFNVEEKKNIVIKIQDNVKTNKTKTFYSERQYNTEDALFPLAYKDFYQDAYKINYIVDSKTHKENRIKTVTDYAVAKGAFYAGDNRTSPYWLRSTGTESTAVSTIGTIGDIMENSYVESTEYGICPAMYIKKI